VSIVHDRIADLLAATLAERAEWDEPPDLYLMFIHDGMPVLRSFGIPGWVWDQARPPDVLARMARSWEADSRRIQRVMVESIHGVAFRYEGWRVELPGQAARAEIEALERASGEHRLHEHPARIEERDIVAVDRAGTTFMVSWARGEAEPHREVVVRRLATEGMSGAVPDALDRMVTALLGVPLPVRPQPRY
jgi:hypothetical protein